MLALYRELLNLRRRKQILYSGSQGTWSAEAVNDSTLAVRLKDQDDIDAILIIVSLTGGPRIALRDVGLAELNQNRNWRLLLDSDDSRFAGAGAAAKDEPGVYGLSSPRGLVLERA
jgi:hypothetical protein